jgi:hypothetical protein
LQSTDIVERVKRLAEGAGQVDVVAENGRDSLGFIYETGESEAAAHVLVGSQEAFTKILGLSIHFNIEHGGFEAPDAAQTPTGGDHVRYQTYLDRARRLKIFEIVVQHFQELVLAFVLENQGCGGDAVADGVYRTSGTAFGCDRAAGFGGFSFG